MMANLIDDEQLNKCLQKIELYKNEERLIFLDLKNSYKQNCAFYHTNNSKLLVRKIEELNRIFSSIELEHDQNVKTIVQTIEKYNNTREKIDQMFENIQSE